jgi:peptidoglycan/xylan/chitin deacetylase (PgdA/CDA1 family)
MGFIAYFFILASKVGRPGYMDWQQIKELSDYGMIIGSHGMTHRIMTELSEEELNQEIVDSKKILEENLKQTINYFSIPRGFYDKRIINKAKQAGYQAVFTSNVCERRGFKIGRIPVMGDWDLEYFIQVVNKGYSLKDNSREVIKACLKRILGTRGYDVLRTRMLRPKTKD